MTDNRGHGDQGVAAVFFALVLVVLMLFAAFAVDFGMLYNARRLDQNAADAAALAAAQEVSSSTSAMFTQVDQVASATLGVGTSTVDWTACSLGDPDAVDLPISVSGTTYNCITTDGVGRVQVKLPTEQLNTTFSRVVGRDTLDHTAFAIAGLESVGFGDVLPFGIPSSSNDSYECIKSGSGGHSEPPCNGAQEGNFGTLDFSFFGDPARGTVEQCSGNENGRIENNIAVGIDHDLMKYVGDPRGQVRDDLECGGTERLPNSMKGETGNRPSALGPGIYFGSTYSDGGPARLKRSDANLFDGASAPKEIIGTHALDDNPLWEFIAPIDANGNGTVDVPPSCQKAIFTEVLAGNYSNLPTSPVNVQAFIQGPPATPRPKAEQMRFMLDRCFTHYKGSSWNPGSPGAFAGSGEATSCAPAPTGCTEPVFGRNSVVSEPEVYDIQYTPRFGYVPKMTTAFGTPADTPSIYRISSFRAIYIQRLLGGCSGTGACGLDFEPGVPVAGSSVPGGGTAEALTSWVFPATMLPNGLAGEGAPFAIGKNRFVRLIR